MKKASAWVTTHAPAGTRWGKRTLALLLSLVLCLSLLPGTAFAADDPILISSAQELKNFAQRVNNGETALCAKLMNDIDLAGSETNPWTPIGSKDKPYSGTFDGGGKTITGLYVTGDRAYAGLFGFTEGATIKNVTVDGYVSASGNNDNWYPCTGGIVGAANNTHIENCTNLSIVKSDFTNDGGSNYVGGIAGNLNGGTIINCQNSGKVILEFYTGMEFRAGGIVGYSSGQVSSCCNTGAVTANSKNTAEIKCLNIGGVVGLNGAGAQVESCYNTGAVKVTGAFDFNSGNAAEYVVGFGGVVGLSNGTVSKCYNTGAVSCSKGNVGGVAGVNYEASVTNCYFLKDTATKGVGNTVMGGTTENIGEKTKAEFADGTVLKLLQNGDENSPWGECGYLEAAGMIVPLLSWQTSDTFPIYTKADLETFRDAVNAGNTDIHAKLMEDIDLAGSNTDRWTPISREDKPYSGTFDGGGKTIKGLYVDEREKNTSAGLFGYIEIAGSGTPVVQNLTVEGTVFAGNETNFENANFGAGILVGEITVLAGSGAEYGTIKNCHVSGTVSSSMQAGGLAGKTKFTHFENCTADVKVEGNVLSGGFVGRADQSEFKDCAAYGNVTSTGPSTGGFAGLLYDRTTVEHCAAYGDVEADGRNIGGFAGYVENSVTITNSIAMGDVVSTRDNIPSAGGFAGVVVAEEDKTVTFEKCHANGKVTTAEGRDGYGMIGQVSNNFKTTDCSYNSEKNPSLKATPKGALEGTEGKNTAGVLYDVCVNYCRGEHTDTDKDHKCDVCETVLSECADNDNDGKCDVCGKVLRSSSTGGSSSRPGYTVTVEKSTNGAVSADRKTASRGTTVTVTVTPDEGYTLETLTVTDKNGNELKLTDKGNGKYSFTMPSGKVTVTATFMDDNTMPNYFVDVNPGAYYYDAVLWAAQKGITSGTDAVHFSPNQPCTRAQIVTFLWRAAGSPVVDYAMTMSDVPEGSYYAEAVRWALSEGITTGTTESTFSPNEACTRAQAVAFLFRYAAPEAVTLQELVSGFGDAASVPGYALPAMNWALADGIVQGDGSNLLPNDSCTRAQIVTFLYRALEK